MKLVDLPFVDSVPPVMDSPFIAKVLLFVLF